MFFAACIEGCVYDYNHICNIHVNATVHICLPTCYHEFRGNLQLVHALKAVVGIFLNTCYMYILMSPCKA